MTNSIFENPDFREILEHSLQSQRIRMARIASQDACTQEDKNRISNTIKTIDQILDILGDDTDGINKIKDQVLVEQDSDLS